MSPASSEPVSTCHVVAFPYPGRGHVNPMMNLCKSLSSHNQSIQITLVLTEEWLGFIGSEPKPGANIGFATIANVLPSELVRAANMPSFIEAVRTEMVEPFEQLLDRLETQPTIIVSDVFISWVVNVGIKRNVPVAMLWPMPATVFSIFYHFDLLVRNGHFPVDLSDRGDELVDYIPGLSPIKIVDLPPIVHGGHQLLNHLRDLIANVSKARYLLFTSISELEAPVIQALKPEFPFPLYSLGPLVPQFNPQNTTSLIHHYPEYLKWLDSQPQNSVLYVSLGSYLSVSSAQMEEIIAGLCDSCIRFIMVTREKGLISLKDNVEGMIVPWCEQLKVLCHSSIGGFWTHCGWNSTMESVFAGVPMLTFPLIMDQFTISKFVVEDWKIGSKVNGENKKGSLVKGEDIAKLVKWFMNPDNVEKRAMVERAKKIGEICRRAISEGGSSYSNLDSFIRNIIK